MDENEWPMNYEEQVAGMMVILRGWIQNLSRNAQGEGVTLEPALIADALRKLAVEYDSLTSADADDIDAYLKLWTDGRGSE